MDRFNLGTHQRTVSTTAPQTQRFFDLGLNWCYAFNHEEAVKCFERAIELDPDCVMAHWGAAYGAGPFVNYTWRDFSDAEAAEATTFARGHLDLARAGSQNATDVENQLVEALTSRFQEPRAVQPETYDRWDDDYAAAMRRVYELHEADHDVMAIFAEALMMRTPWRLWDVRTGEPKPGADTIEGLEVIERSIAMNDAIGQPQHPGILHMHIHFTEMSGQPERAIRSADRLGDMCPDAGHLNHMPGHTYVLCGSYDRAKVASENAIRADNMYAEYANSPSFYTLARCHDLHLMMYACMFLGQFGPALAAAEKLCEILSEDVLSVKGKPQMAATAEGYYSMKMHVLVRFGKWSEIVAHPMPKNPELYCVSTAMHHYAKGVAHSALGNINEATAQRVLFAESVNKIAPGRKIFNNKAHTVLGVAEKMLDGELEYRKGNYRVAFEHLRQAVDRDDNLEYTEPWAWMHPPRHALAALLSEQDHYEEAEDVYRADLGLSDALQRCGQHPDNVWALHGLVECLRQRDETVERVALELKLEQALAKADVVVESSCMCRGQTSA